MTATALAAAIRSTEVSPVEVAEYYLDRIDRLDGEVNAIVWRDDERLLADARAAEKRVLEGGDLPPFLGVPIPVKELTTAAGQPNTRGSLGFSDRVQTEDDLCIALLREAGAVFLGRSNSPELGPMSVSDNRRYGRTANPWDLGRTAGGSSGGAAAAVVAGLAPAAQASDGGGSIRMPSSCCGTVGLKPSRGRVPQLVGAWNHGVTDGMITRSVQDAAAFLDVLGVPDRLAWYSAPRPERPFVDEVGRDQAPLRIGLLLDPPTGVPVDPECVLAAQRLATELERLGHTVVPATLQGYSYPAVMGYLDVVVNASLLVLPYEDPTLAEPYIQHRMELGRRRHAGEYAAVDAQLQIETRSVNAQWGRDWDVLLTPTMATVAPPIGTVLEEANRDPSGPRVAENQMISFTAFVNIAGKLLAFVLSGLVASAAGVLLLARQGAATADNGMTMLFPALTAVLLSTIVIDVGRPSVLGTVIGVLFLAVSTSGLTLIGSPAWVSQVFSGAALLLAVGVAGLGRLRRSR